MNRAYRTGAFSKGARKNTTDGILVSSDKDVSAIGVAISAFSISRGSLNRLLQNNKPPIRIKAVRFARAGSEISAMRKRRAEVTRNARRALSNPAHFNMVDNKD